MTSIEIMALILAVFGLIKLIIVLVKPETWMKISDALLKKNIIVAIIYVILAIITGYYLLQNLTIIEIGATMLFTSILIAIAWIPYSDELMQLKHRLIKDGLRKSWVAIIIWMFLFVWIIYSVLMG